MMVLPWNSANLVATCASCNCVIKHILTCNAFRCWEGISNPGGYWFLVVGLINILSSVLVPHLGTLVIVSRSTLSLFDPSCCMQLAFNIYEFLRTRFGLSRYYRCDYCARGLLCFMATVLDVRFKALKVTFPSFPLTIVFPGLFPCLLLSSSLFGRSTTVSCSSSCGSEIGGSKNNKQRLKCSLILMLMRSLILIRARKLLCISRSSSLS